MKAVINWLAALFADIPLPLLEIWGRFSCVIGFALALCAFGGFTFRIGSGWGFGRERQAWDSKAFICIPLTFVAVLAGGYIGSSIVLVPGAQTFESLKDLVVFLCVVLFGYPALITVPFAYGLSDLIEGIPPDFLVAWLPGYFINPACFWVAYQLIGKNPDFRRVRTWGAYLLFVAIFMGLEPVLWGYICSDKFTPVISYQAITPALFFTTGITWLLGPFAMLAALPLARKSGMFWAEISGHVRERAMGRSDWAWEAGTGRRSLESGASEQGLPIRMFILGPFVALVLLMVGVTAYVTMHSARDDANRLATRLHQEIADNINLQLDEYLARASDADNVTRSRAINSLLKSLPIAVHGRAFILDRAGAVVSSSAAGDDPVVDDARASLTARADVHTIANELQFRFDHVTAKPLARETWLAHANPYRDRGGGHTAWLVVTAMPESYYLAGVREASSRSAMVFALALLLALAVAAILASTVATPLWRIAFATQSLAQGDLSQRVPGSRLEELRALAQSFNRMADQRKRDVTEQLLAEQELRRHRDHLEELVRERTLELDAANRAKSAFLANMSHEIRTPMNVILGFGQLMERESDLTVRDRDRLAKILASGHHLLALINNVLEMSKIEAGRMVLSEAAFDLHEAIADVDAMVRDAITHKGLGFAIEGVDALPRYVLSDAVKLRQVLLNLLGNAAKFTERGGVSLRARAEQAGEQIKLHFEVQDTGVGIAADEIDKVFEPFEQTASGLSAKTGTGLGVPISRSVARLMGGDLRVHSVVGVGTTFVLEVRVALAARADVSFSGVWDGRVVGLEADQKRPLVLVVDDERDNRLALAELLKGAGIEVAEAEHGARAVELFVELGPDLVFMDLKMPVMDGVEATRRIRETARGATAPIVILSASVLEGERSLASQIDANAFIAKPFEAAEIWRVLERHAGVRFIRHSVALTNAAPVTVTRAQIAALGPETVAALRSALETGYLDRVSTILAGVNAEHAAVVSAVCKLAESYQIEALIALL